jgi:integrase
MIPAADTISPAVQLALLEAEMAKRGRQQGSLRKKNGSWYGQYFEHRQDENGNIRYMRTERVLGTCSGPSRITTTEARDKLRDLVQQANALAHCPKGIATFGQFVDSHYKPGHMLTLKPATKAMYHSILRRHILPTLEPIPMAEINTKLLQLLIGAKVEAGLSAQTITHIRNIISSVFRHAKRLGFHTGELPTEYLVLPKMQRKERGSLTPQQLRALIGALPHPWAAVAEVMACTGLRRGEMEGLRWTRVNLSDLAIVRDGEIIPANSLLVREQWQGGALETLKTPRSRRTVPLSSTAWVALSLHQQMSGSTDFVFEGRSGRPLDLRNALKRQLKRAGTATGIPGICWHQLRHTFATFATMAGVTSSEKAALLGHASIKISEQYTHLDGPARDKLERLN